MGRRIAGGFRDIRVPPSPFFFPSSRSSPLIPPGTRTPSSPPVDESIGLRTLPIGSLLLPNLFLSVFSRIRRGGKRRESRDGWGRKRILKAFLYPLRHPSPPFLP